MMRFDKSGKLSQRHVGPFEFLIRESGVAYQLALLLTLTLANDMFHLDASHKIDFGELKIPDMSYIKKSPEDSRLLGKGTKNENDPYGEGSLEESPLRRSHLRGRS